MQVMMIIFLIFCFYFFWFVSPVFDTFPQNFPENPETGNVEFCARICAKNRSFCIILDFLVKLYFTAPWYFAIFLHFFCIFWSFFCSFMDTFPDFFVFLWSFFVQFPIRFRKMSPRNPKNINTNNNNDNNNNSSSDNGR